MQLPIAPPQGLFLDMSVYDAYNNRKDQGSSEVESLDWIHQEQSPAMQRWKKFKEEVTLKHIIEEEAKEGNFVEYLYLQMYVFDSNSNYKGVEVDLSEKPKKRPFKPANQEKTEEEQSEQGKTPSPQTVQAPDAKEIDSKGTD